VFSDLGQCLGDGFGKLSDATLRRQFVLIDKDGSGSLDQNELRTVFSNLGIEADRHTIAKLFTMADIDGNGSIDWREFRKIFQVVNAVNKDSGLHPLQSLMSESSRASKRASINKFVNAVLA